MGFLTKFFESGFKAIAKSTCLTGGFHLLALQRVKSRESQQQIQLKSAVL